MDHTILLTGGAGFIGSHTAVALLERGCRVVALDNLSNASGRVPGIVRELSGRELTFVDLDIRDEAGLDELFSRHRFDAVIHFAGLKAVGESWRRPLDYYQNNLSGTLSLFAAMDRAACRNLVYSSSATVYGDQAQLPVSEDMPLSATNPYGRSKLFTEDICRDLAAQGTGWRIALLRYFNPVGAHPSGRLGEDPQGIPTNLMPSLLQAASGRRPHLEVYGGRYPTPDGTGIRDYIHVQDLAEGHLMALDALSRIQGAMAINLGTGKGHSVLEMVEAMSRAVGSPIPYQVVDPRPGDVAVSYADVSLAERFLGWTAKRGLDEMCEDAWRWHQRHPQGYGA